MGVTVYFDAIPQKYYQEFENVFNLNDYENFKKHYDWLKRELHTDGKENYLPIRNHHFEVQVPIAESPFISEDVREKLAHDLCTGEGARHYLKSYLDYKNYISNEILKKHLAVLEVSDLSAFRKYAISFFEKHRRNDRFEQGRPFNEFIDNYLSDSKTIWENKYEELLEREKRMLEQLKKEEKERKARWKMSEEKENLRPKPRELRSNIDALFSAGNKENTSAVKKSPANNSVTKVSEIPTKEELLVRRLNGMIRDLEDGFLIYRKLIGFMREVSNKGDWVIIS